MTTLLELFKNDLFPMGLPILQESQAQLFHDSILKKEINPNYLDKYQRNVIHSLVLMDDPSWMEKFVSLGCTANLQDKFGYRPFDYACDNCCYRVVEWFFQWESRIENANPNYYKDPNETDKSSFNSATKDHPHQSIKRIHKICGRPYQDNLLNLVQVFVKWGANLFETDGTYYQGTPLFWAQRANKGQESNPLILYLEKEMEHQLISGRYQNEKLERQLPNSLIVDNYKLNPSIQPCIEDDLDQYHQEKETLQQDIYDLQNKKEKLQRDLVLIQRLLKNALDSIQDIN